MNKKKTRFFIGLAGLVAILGVAALVLVFRLTSAQGEKAEEQIATPTPMAVAQEALQPTLEPNLVEPQVVDPAIQSLRDELLNPDLSAEARKSVEEKLEMAERMALEQASGASQERIEKAAPDFPSELPEVFKVLEFEEGIFEGSEGMIRPSVAQIINVWQGMVKGHLWQVFAGSPADRSDLGALYIFIENPAEMKRTMETVIAPGATGRLRILAVEEGVMTLETLDGKQLFFDLETRQFHE